jgi:hypothetical protein
MIENKLNFGELSRILQPFLRLESLPTIIAVLQDILCLSITKPSDILCQTKILVTYRGYRIDIRDLRAFPGKGVSVHIQFKAKQRWWHGFRDQNAQLVGEIAEYLH